MSKKFEADDFGSNLKSARIHFGKSEAQLAEIIGVDKSTISKWESNDARPRPQAYQTLRDFFKVASFDIPHSEFKKLYGFTKEYNDIGKIKLFTPDYYKKISQLVGDAKEFVHFSSLCLTTSRRGTFRPTELLDEAFCKRLREGEIVYKRVQIFFTKQQLINAMEDECIYFGQGYHCRYYPTPPICMPVINIRSFDNQVFVIGGMHNDVANESKEYDLVFSDKQPVRDFLMEYWRLLWSSARPFPKPGSWLGIEEIAKSVGMGDDELQNVFQKLKDKHPQIA